MPELPEVETLRRTLALHLVGRRIVEVNVVVLKMLSAPAGDPDAFSQIILGHRIDKISRRGKHLIFDLDMGYHLLFHLKMRGQIVVVPHEAEVEKYHALTLVFDSGFDLRFYDIWTWGAFGAVTGDALSEHPALTAMGAEPLDDSFTDVVLKGALAKRSRTTIKAAILDQSVVAGVGNIYADESLFRSGIRPDRKVGDLASEEITKLTRSIRAVLLDATGDGGTASDNYVDADGIVGRYHPQVYDRAGKPCDVCGEQLSRIKVAGRGTVFCPSCQK